MIQSIALTADERRRLENEMRAQHHHPLALQVQQEAAERTLRNERAYYRSNSGHIMARDQRVQRTAEMLRSARNSRSGSSRRGSSRNRDWNQIVDSFERNGHGQVHSIDDLVVLEAAILLSMEEEARNGGSTGGESSSAFDPSEHAGQGFPLARSFLARGGGDASSSLRGAFLAEALRPSASSRRSGRRSQQQQGRMRSSGNLGLDTAAMMMHGMSEEDQIAMAIAASLQEQASTSASDDNDIQDSGSLSNENHTTNDNNEIENNNGAPPESAPSNDPVSPVERDRPTSRSPSVDDDVCDSTEFQLELENGERAAVGVLLEESIAIENDDVTEDNIAVSDTATPEQLLPNQSMTGVGIGIALSEQEENETIDNDNSEDEDKDTPPSETENRNEPGDMVPDGAETCEASNPSESPTSTIPHPVDSSPSEEPISVADEPLDSEIVSVSHKSDDAISSKANLGDETEQPLNHPAPEMGSNLKQTVGDFPDAQSGLVEEEGPSTNFNEASKIVTTRNVTASEEES